MFSREGERAAESEEEKGIHQRRLLYRRAERAKENEVRDVERGTVEEIYGGEREREKEREREMNDSAKHAMK